MTLAEAGRVDRRGFLSVCSRAGVASALLPGVLYTLAAQAQTGGAAEGKSARLKITPELLDQAALLAGVTLTPEQKKLMLEGAEEQLGSYAAIRALKIPNSVAPAFVFHPLPAAATLPAPQTPRTSAAPTPPTLAVPANLEDLAFSTVGELGSLLANRKITSLALTQMYLARLKRYDSRLHFVISLTEERALSQARAADAEIAAGRYRGPLHGIPWGAKDLLAVKGYPTTWGAGGFEKQSFDSDATVVERLDAAGAVLVAKFTPRRAGDGRQMVWRPDTQSVEYRAGVERVISGLGECGGRRVRRIRHWLGNAGLDFFSLHALRRHRPTPHLRIRAPHRAMALSWTMDKLGPICRSVADCAMVLQAIHGPDGKDTSVAPASFQWNADADWKQFRIGYLKTEFEIIQPFKPQQAAPGETPDQKKEREHNNTLRAAGHARREYDQRFDLAAIEKLRAMGVNLIPVELPKLPYGAMVPLLTAEAAAAFDDLTMSGRDSLLTEQGPEDWPNAFRIARFYPAVEYIQANRARTLAIGELSKIFDQVDIIVTPTNGDQLVATNLSGHPALILPNGLRGDDSPKPPKTDDGEDDAIGGPGTPVSLTFLAGHYQDAKLCAFARAYQQATGFHKLHPKLD